MRTSKEIIFILILINFMGCNQAIDLFDGGINHVSVGQDGLTSFNPPVNPVTPTTKPATTTPTSSETKGIEQPAPITTPIKSASTSGIDNSFPPSLPSSPPPPPPQSSSTTSLLDGLPDLSKKIFLSERESAGMPRVNGERIEADVYGSDILIIRYSKNLNKIRYSNDIKNIDKLGQIEGQNARVAYPTSFVKIFFEAKNGDIEAKIFGLIESE